MRNYSMKGILMIGLIFLFIRCNETENKSDINSNADSLKSGSNLKVILEKEDISLKNSDTSGAFKIVNEFYNWYIKKVYNTKLEAEYEPAIIKVKEFKYQLDTSKYLKALRNTHYFSNKFVDDAKKQITVCNEAMINMDFKDEPEAYFNDNECGFLWGNQWIGGQGQEVDDFKIINVNQKQNKTIVEVKILSEGLEFNTFKLELSKFQNEWEIDKIIRN